MDCSRCRHSSRRDAGRVDRVVAAGGGDGSGDCVVLCSIVCVCCIVMEGVIGKVISLIY